ncbi:MAG: DUF5916 domain-containing protein [Vicinamibacterales bacterium]
MLCPGVAAAQQHDHQPPPRTTAAPASPVALANAAASPEQYTIQPPRVAQRPPAIDGVLNDEAWSRAAVIDRFTQQEPVIGQPATERTEVRVMYDANHLYVGVRAYDSSPESIIATEMRRDSLRILDEDNFQIILDTFQDRRSGYVFVTNPLGAKLEEQIFEEGGGNARGASSNVNRDWNGVWDVAARRTSDGWTAEVDIPLVTLRSPNVAVQTWGVNFFRSIRHKNEQVYWAPIPKPYTLFMVSRAGVLTGMRDINRGLDLRVKPFYLGGGRRERTGGATTASGVSEVGLDVKYGLKAGLALDVTLNTDFAQAEVDEQQVNLTRFALFFPEKRDFFLENSGQFTISNQGFERLADLFFSRRIGLSDTGLPIPIIGGARVTGKMPGGNNLAVMNIQTGEAFGRPGENFLVARYSKDVARRSKIGGLFVNKDEMGTGRFNRTLALDGLYMPTSTFSLHTFLAKTSTPGVATEQTAFHARALFWNTKWNTFAEYTDIGDNFNAEVGFVPRRGIRQSKLHLERNPRPGGIIRVMEPMWNVIYTTDQHNRLLTRRFHHMLGTRFQNGTYLNVWWNNWYERLDEPFRIQPAVTIPVGIYRFDELMFMYTSNPARRFYQRLQYSPQTFFDGRRTNYDLALGVRGGSRFSTELALQRNDVRLPWGDFVVDLSILRVDFAFSPRQTLRTLSQYNSYTRQLSTSFRYNFIYRPGSDLFVTYDELQLNTVGTQPLRNRQFAVKTTYLLSR